MATNKNNFNKDMLMESIICNLPVAVQKIVKAEQLEVLTFDAFCAAIKKESTISDAVPELDNVILVEFTKELAELCDFSFAGYAWFCGAEVLADIAKNLDIAGAPVRKGKKVTYERLAKYIGSIFFSDIKIRMEDMGGIVDLSKANLPGPFPGYTHAQAYDGQAYVRPSHAKKYGLHGYSISRIKTNQGFPKGLFVNLNEAFEALFPPGDNYVVCEMRTEYRRPDLADGVGLYFQPSKVQYHTYDESLLSMQIWVMGLFENMNDPEFADLLRSYEDHAMQALPDLIDGKEKLRPAAEADGIDEEDVVEESRDVVLQRVFAKFGASPLVVGHVTKGIASSVTKEFSLPSLKARATSANGSDAITTATLMLPYVALEAAWLARGLTPPAILTAAADAQRALPDTDENGNLIVWVTDLDAFNKNNELPGEAMLLRTPASIATGIHAIVRQLPKDLIPGILGQKFGSELQSWFKPSPAYWEVARALDGMDNDDKPILAKGKLAKLLKNAMAAKKAFLAEQPQDAAEAKELDTLLAQFKKAYSNPAWNAWQTPGIAALMRDLAKLKSGKNGRWVEHASEPKVQYVDEKDLGTAEIFKGIMNVNNPFMTGVGIMAMAHQTAGLLMVPGMVELPAGLNHLRRAISKRALQTAELSLVVDAAQKGEGFEEAHQTVQLLASVWAMVGAYALKSGQPLKVQPELVGRLPVSLRRALTDNVSEDPETKVTLLSWEPLDHPLYQQRHEFLQTTCEYLNEHAMAARDAGRHLMMPMVIDHYIANTSELHKFMPENNNGRQLEVKEFAGRMYQNWFVSPVEISGQTFIFPEKFEYKRHQAIMKIWVNRIQAFGEWSAKHKNASLSEVAAKRTWMRKPLYWAFAGMEAEVRALLKDSPNQEALYKDFLLAFTLVAGWNRCVNETAVSVSYDKLTGAMDVAGGLPSVIFMVSEPDHGFTGPGDAMLEFLDSDIAAEILADIDRLDGDIVISIRKDARLSEKTEDNKSIDKGLSFDPADFVGKTLEDILSIPGLKLADPPGALKETSHECQAPAIRLYANRIEDLRTAELSSLKLGIKRAGNEIVKLKKAKISAGIAELEAEIAKLEEIRKTLQEESQWANFERFGLAGQMRKLVATTIESVEIETRDWSEERAKNASYPNEFLIVRFAVNYGPDSGNSESVFENDSVSDNDFQEETKEIVALEPAPVVTEKATATEKTDIKSRLSRLFGSKPTAMAMVVEAQDEDEDSICSDNAPCEDEEVGSDDDFYCGDCQSDSIDEDESDIISEDVTPAPIQEAMPEAVSQVEDVEIHQKDNMEEKKEFKLELTELVSTYKPTITLNEQQQAVYEELVNGSGLVMVTGNAGTGKSTVIKEAIAALRYEGKAVLVMATTGVAATQIGGVTYHSGLRLLPGKSPKEAAGIMAKSMKVAEFLENKNSVAIIDEVSMMSRDEVDRMDAALRIYFRGTERANLPFGGLRIVFVGDFLQIEPVDKGGKYAEEGAYAFLSESWKNAGIKVMQLTQVVRQKDPVFTALLNNVRLGNVTPWMDRAIKKIADRPIPANIPEFLTHVKDVEAKNTHEMATLPGELFKFEAVDKDPNGFPDFWKKRENRLDDEVTLKVGAVVVHTMNIGTLVNGDVGVVQNIEVFGDNPYITVLWNRTNKVSAVSRVVEAADGFNPQLVYRQQVPLRAAWALTVHKSQGMTLDAAVIDVARAFAAGQTYVAMSRVRSVDGLYFKSYSDNCITAHPAALNFYGLRGNLKGKFAMQHDYLLEARTAAAPAPQMTGKPLYKVAFTGHRPDKLPGGYANQNHPGRLALQGEIKAALERAIAKYGTTHEVVVITGGAQGVDTDAAREAHKLGLRFIVAAPFQGQSAAWPDDAKTRYAAMCKLANAEVASFLAAGEYETDGGVINVSSGGWQSGADNWKFTTRDHWMIDNSDALIAVYDGSNDGGTAKAYAYAKQKQHPVLRINPANFNK